MGEGEAERVQDTSKRIDSIVEEYGGMISREAAEKLSGTKMQHRIHAVKEINDFVYEEGSVVDLEGPIYRIFNPYVFEKEGKKRQIRKIVVGDTESSITITVWDRASEMIDRLVLERGDKVRCYNLVVTRDVKDICLRSRGNTYLVKVAAASSKALSFEALMPGKKDIDIIGKVVSVDPIRYFTDLSRRRTAVSSCMLSDGHRLLKAMLWRSSSAFASDMHPGDYIKIEFASTKNAGNSIEISAGDSARILISSALRPRVKAH